MCVMKKTNRDLKTVLTINTEILTSWKRGLSLKDKRLKIHCKRVSLYDNMIRLTNIREDQEIV